MTLVPQQLLNSLSGQPGFDETAFVEAHREENRITSIRMNPFKRTDFSFETGDEVKWHPGAYYLPERPYFTHDPLFHAGCYYVQEAGSMFVRFALKSTVNISQDVKILDLCAAPGGKSTLINSLISSESLLVANEFIRSRAEILAQNLSRWGTCNTVVTNNDPIKFGEIGEFFDAIVVDAPCSGSGLFRKQPEAIAEWSENAVQACAIRQKKILHDVLPALREGGTLIYCTCSYSLEENEAIVAWLVDEQGLEYVKLTVPDEWGLIESEGGFRFYPHLTKSEGFFCATLRKNTSNSAARISKKISESLSKTETSIVAPYLGKNITLVTRQNGFLHLINNAAREFAGGFGKQFYFKKAGVALGEIKGSDLVANQELAWSLALSSEVERAEMDLEKALKFLKKENLKADENVMGLRLVTYKGFGIGWAKFLQNRVNNYLPNELRVLR